METERRSTAFTTRGALTYEFCEKVGLKKHQLDGDVAFFDRRFDGRNFEKKQVQRILISDPHRTNLYLSSLKCLCDGISDLFPYAEVALVQHGINPEVEAFCNSEGIKNIQIYKDKGQGLEVYDNADLHVGFRVHGHVSALKRRKYSYLLEQDGRGCDYGLTLEPKISVPNYASLLPEPTVKNVIKFLTRRPMTKGIALSGPAEEMIALIRKDLQTEFSKFEGLEQQIIDFNTSTYHSVQKALSTT